MAKIIRMPEVLAGADEAVIAQWLIAEGSEVTVGEILAEIETEKATVEYESEDAGTLGRVLLGPGQSANVGDPIAVFLEPGDGDDAIDKALADAGIEAEPAPTPPPASAAATAPATPENQGQDATSANTSSRAAAAAPEPTAPETTTAVGASPTPVPSRHDADRLFISPIARKLAKERGIDPTNIPGTGPEGRIVRKDVEGFSPSTAVTPAAPAAVAAVAAPAPVPAAPDSPPAGGSATPGGYTDTKHSPMRRAIARRLTESKSTVPHFYLVADVRVDRLLSLRQEVNSGLDTKVSVNDWIIKAVATALKQVPDANVIWSDDSLRHFHDADISVAVATEGGLYTPVVRGANRMSLTEISQTVKDLAERSRSGKIRQDEIEGGSFAVTNLGMWGTQEFSAILNPPQSGILAVGAAKERPVVEDGELTVGKLMTITLSCDHRAIDGALAAVFLDRLQTLLEHPASLLAV